MCYIGGGFCAAACLDLDCRDYCNGNAATNNSESVARSLEDDG